MTRVPARYADEDPPGLGSYYGLKALALLEAREAKKKRGRVPWLAIHTVIMSALAGVCIAMAHQRAEYFEARAEAIATPIAESIEKALRGN